MSAAKTTARPHRHVGLTMLRRRRTTYPSSPEKARLETFENAHPGRDYRIRFVCPEFTSICPITGQPDFGQITIDYVADRRCVESKSLKLYLHAFRNRGTFHEEAVNHILDDFIKACRPRRARVTGEFNARGGIAITVTAEHPAGLSNNQQGISNPQEMGLVQKRVSRSPL